MLKISLTQFSDSYIFVNLFRGLNWSHLEENGNLRSDHFVFMVVTEDAPLEVELVLSHCQLVLSHCHS